MHIKGTILPKVLLLAITLLFGLASCEVLLRLLTREPTELSLLRADDFQAIYFEPDPVLGIVRRPDLDIRFRFEERPSGFIHFQTNNLGLRRIAPTEPDKGAKKRILVLGDSQIDGSVDNRENVCALLEKRLNSGPTQYEVLNAAIGSYSPYQCYLWYRTRGRKLEPDVVMLTIFLGNDLAELVAPGRPRLMPEGAGFHEISATEDYQRRMKTYQEPSAWRKLRFFLLQNSVLFGRLSSLSGGSEVEAPGPMGAAYRTCIGCTGQSLGQAYWFKHRPGDVRTSMRTLKELLRRFKETVERSGGRPIVLVLPSRLQVEAEQDVGRIRAVAKILGLTEADLALESRLGGESLSIARGLKIDTIDLAPALEEFHRRSGENLYYWTDWHLDTAGHRFLAQQLYDRVLR
jgi:lysophospholipase L1-like esterase